MGLLDEAIRDHLDLKRRRGADPTEIERAEAEALGPVRRDPFEHGPDDFEPGAFPDDQLRAYDQEEEPYDDEAYEEYGAEEEWEEEEPGDLADSRTVMDHEYLEEPRAPMADEPAASPPYPAGAGAGDETMQYDVEEALAAEPPEAERSPEWVEQSDEWVEQSEDWVEPSRQPVEPPHEGAEPPHEPLESPHEPGEHGAPQTEAGPPYFDPAEQDVGSEESPPHREPPAASHDHEAKHRGKSEQDVLDETPEFLQDEPDHDQLWFEQRPPRDFDFDG